MSTWIMNNKKSAEEEYGHKEPVETPKSFVQRTEVTFEKNLLVLLMDVNPAQEYLSKNPKALFYCLDAFITFGTAHLSLNPNNEVVVIAFGLNGGSHYVYPRSTKDELEKKLTMRQSDGQFEGFLQYENTVRENLNILTRNYTGLSKLKEISSSQSNGCLASSLCRALCYINRKQKELSEHYVMNSRICILTGSDDSTEQYMAFMNVFHAAQKMDVVIDSCVIGLGPKIVTLLSQGADLTKGTYLSPPQGHIGLLQHLFWSFLSDKTIRNQLARPFPFPVDYRTTCFCHRQLISVGFVCSTCLSIYCMYVPVCSTCGAMFNGTLGPVSIPFVLNELLFSKLQPEPEKKIVTVAFKT